MRLLAMLVPSAVMVAVSFFCAFGFLASFEAVPNALAWRIAYAAAGLVALDAAVALVREGLRRPDRVTSEPRRHDGH